jgi:CBS domain-containing protein
MTLSVVPSGCVSRPRRWAGTAPPRRSLSWLDELHLGARHEGQRGHDRQVELASPDDTLEKAAGRMAELDTGVLPVGEGDRLVGMLTDRDIAVRAVAQGKGPDARVRDAMTPAVKYCFEDEDLNDVVHTMAEQKVRRLPVMSREKRLVGIVSLGDVAIYADSKQTDAAVSAVSEPGGPHTQAG